MQYGPANREPAAAGRGNDASRVRHQRCTVALVNPRLGPVGYPSAAIAGASPAGPLPLQKQKLGTKTGPHGGKQTHRAGLRTAVLHYVFEHNED